MLRCQESSTRGTYSSRYITFAGLVCSITATSFSEMPKVTSAGVDSLKVLFEPFEDRFHRFIRPFPIHIEVDAAF